MCRWTGPPSFLMYILKAYIVFCFHRGVALQFDSNSDALSSTAPVLVIHLKTKNVISPITRFPETHTCLWFLLQGERTGWPALL